MIRVMKVTNPGFHVETQYYLLIGETNDKQVDKNIPNEDDQNQNEIEIKDMAEWTGGGQPAWSNSDIHFIKNQKLINYKR